MVRKPGMFTICKKQQLIQTSTCERLATQKEVVIIWLVHTASQVQFLVVKNAKNKDKREAREATVFVGVKRKRSS